MSKKLLWLLVLGLALTTAFPAAAQSVQLLQNSAFDDWTNGGGSAPDHWTNVNADSIFATRCNDTTHNAPPSCRLTWISKEQSECEFISDVIAVTAGATYSCSTWVFDNDLAGRARIFFRWSTGDTYMTTYSSDSPVWQRLTYQYVAPVGATTLRVLLRCYDTSPWDGNATIYVDDFILWGPQVGGNIPPSITPVYVYPYPVFPGEIARVRATITDSDGTIVKDSLYLRALPGGFSAAAHDSIAAGGNYWYTIGSRSVGDTVEYYVIATDDDGARSQSPTQSYAVQNQPVPIYSLQHTLIQGAPSPSGPCFSSDSILRVETISGIVVGRYERPARRNWLFVQDADSLWSAIYVYISTDTAQIGDSVTIIGTVNEYTGETEFATITSQVKHSSGNALPAPQVITCSTLGSGYICAEPQAEPYEAMLIRIDSLMVTSDAGFGDYWGRDGSNDSCKIMMATGAQGDNPPVVTIGRSYRITGIGRYAFDYYGIAPRTASDVVPVGGNSPPSIPTVNRYPYPRFIIPTDIVAIRATIVDLDGIVVKDSLYVRANFGAYAPVPHDSITGTSFYWYTISPHALDDTVEYYVIAYDDSSARGQSTLRGYRVMSPSPPVVPIYSIQHTTNEGAWPLCFPSDSSGRGLSITGKVVGRYDRPGGSPLYRRQFFVQDAATPWSGVYVYQATDTAQVGDSVTVSGAIQEYLGMTELASISTLIKHSSGRPLPAANVITCATLGNDSCSASAEPYEGMTIQINNITVRGSAGTGNLWATDGSGDSCIITDALYYQGTDPPAIDSGTTYTYIRGIGLYLSNRYRIAPRFSSDVYIAPGQCSGHPVFDIENSFSPTGPDSADCWPSPYAGQVVTVCGTVTAVTQGNRPWFYMQDQNNTAWGGIYCYDDSLANGDSIKVRLADYVELNAHVSEIFGWTALDVLNTRTVLGTNQPLPDTTVITVSVLTGMCDYTTEPYENILVRLNNVTVLSSNGGGQYWIRDASSPDSIRIGNDLWALGPDQPSPLPAPGIVYDRIVGIVKWEGRQGGAGNIDRGWIVLPRFGSDCYSSSPPQGCHYIPGDVNGSGQFDGIDVGMAVNFFRGATLPPTAVFCPPCSTLGLNMAYPEGDVNATCSFNGIDIGYMVNHFKYWYPGPPEGPYPTLYCPGCAPLPAVAPYPGETPAVQPILKSKGEAIKGESQQ